MTQPRALRKGTPSSAKTKTNATAHLHQLLLYTPVRSIDNILLAEELQRELKLSCHLTSNPQELSSSQAEATPTAPAQIDGSRPSDQNQSSLLLFDCKEISAMELQNLLRKLPKNTRCALLNLVPDSVYDRLIEWPQVRGMFYQNAGMYALLKGVRAVLEGELWLPRHLCHEFINRRRREPSHPLIISLPAKLTRRERQALEGIYSGKNNSALARQLKLSEHTIKSHLYSAYKKIGVKSRLEASNWLRDHYSLLDKLSSK